MNEIETKKRVIQTIKQIEKLKYKLIQIINESILELEKMLSKKMMNNGN